MHTAPSPEAVRDLIPTFFELLREEKSAEVRVVLGHFIFVYIHPFMDGNGRIGRFLMNLMLASGGYPWLVIPVERRNEYMNTLEAASVDQDIVPFTKFLADLLKDQLEFKINGLSVLYMRTGTLYAIVRGSTDFIIKGQTVVQRET